MLDATIKQKLIGDDDIIDIMYHTHGDNDVIDITYHTHRRDVGKNRKVKAFIAQLKKRDDANDRTVK